MDEKQSTQRIDPELPIYQLKITLEDVDPPVWRRVCVDDCLLSDLHDIIQTCMDWYDDDEYAFEISGLRYADPSNGDPFYDEDEGDEDEDDDDEGDGSECEDAREISLRDLVLQGESTFRYGYDCGDGWSLVVSIEGTLAPEPGVEYPRCVEGRRASPPEETGGPDGYAEFLEALQDPEHERHEEALEWCEGEFDPESFDFDGVNRALRRARQFLGGERMGPHMPEPKFNGGDQVRVRQGVACPDYPDIPMGGWAGTVVATRHLTPLAHMVRWSEATLEGVHPVFTKRCRRDSEYYRTMLANEDDLELDSGGPLAIEQPTNLITKPLDPDEPEDRIRAMFGLTGDDPLPYLSAENVQTYGEYLKTHLSFPFEADCYGPEESFADEDCQAVTVTGIPDEFIRGEDGGIVCLVRHGEQTLEIPLAGLAVDEDHPNVELLTDYYGWFTCAVEESEDDEFFDEEYGERIDDESDDEDEDVYWDDESDEDDFDDDFDDDSPGGRGLDWTDDDVLRPIVKAEDRIGRNDPCPCGSGKKYKKCCLRKTDIEF